MAEDIVTFKDLTKIEVISLDSLVILNHAILSHEVVGNLTLGWLLG